MKRSVIAIIAIVLASCAQPASEPSEAETIPWPEGLPVYDHVVIVVEENKDYSEIIGSDNAPYINNVLRAEGANFTQAFGEEHFSQGNYYWLFSGDNHGIGFSDDVPDWNIPGYPFEAANLGASLIENGYSFKGYSESLPEAGSMVHLTKDSCGTWIYARKHVPWISFKNVPNGSDLETSSNLSFEEFPAQDEYSQLPTVAFVIPNLENDMHNCRPAACFPCGEPCIECEDGRVACGDECIPARDDCPPAIDACITAGDRWLEDNLDSYYQWAKTNNSLLILTFDEDNDRRGFKGLTDPFYPIPEGKSCRAGERDDELEDACERRNGIVTIFAGAHIKPGDYAEGKGITHVNILRTLEAMYGLPKAGAQQPNAAAGGISDDYIITDVFEEISP